MKHIISIFLILTAVAFASDKTTAVFTVDHQMHQGCKEKITKNMRFEKGVKSIDVSLPKNTITIVYDPQKTDPEKLVAGFKGIGFNALLISDTDAETSATGDKKRTK